MSNPARQAIGCLTRHASSRPSVPVACYRPARRCASFSFGSLGNLFRSGRRARDQAQAEQQSVESQVGAIEREQPKGLFDAVQDDAAIERQLPGYAAKHDNATFHKSSTANFKSSRRKLNDLGRLIAGRGVDEAILQLQASQKKQAPRLLSMLALARNHAMAKGLSREQLIVAQSWVTKGAYLKRLDIKGRGRFGVKHHPSAKLHVLLAEGLTKEEKKRERAKSQFRASVRGLSEVGGVGVGKSRPIINAGVGGWKW